MLLIVVPTKKGGGSAIGDLITDKGHDPGGDAFD
jgi:hypothetical protein